MSTSRLQQTFANLFKSTLPHNHLPKHAPKNFNSFYYRSYLDTVLSAYPMRPNINQIISAGFEPYEVGYMLYGKFNTSSLILSVFPSDRHMVVLFLPLNSPSSCKDMSVTMYDFSYSTALKNIDNIKLQLAIYGLTQHARYLNPDEY